MGVTDCLVKNTDLALEYGILVDKCPNNKVHFTTYGTNDDSLLNKFSYKVFEFKVAPASTLQISCSVVVCAEDAVSSTCKDAAVCSKRRKKRSVFPEHETFLQVSKTIHVV